MAFVKAVKNKQRARVALIGPSGSGKTYTALLLAKAMGSRIAVIDTEHGSASKYAGDVADFDTTEIDGTYAPKFYTAEIRAAAREGFDVLVIDSLSHAWEGEGGILSQVDAKGGRFDAWKGMDPQLRELVDAILSYPGHVIATLRTKTEWVVEETENKRGGTSKAPRKIGLAPRFKDGLEYEFDVVGLMDDRHVLTVTKSRCSALADEVIVKPGAKLAATLLAWLDDGAARASAADVVAMLDAATTDADIQAARELSRTALKGATQEQRDAAKAAGEAARARVDASDRRAILEAERAAAEQA